MKKTGIIVIIIFIVLLFLHSLFNHNKQFNTKPYENKIDSLTNKIKVIEKQNDSLELSIYVLENNNSILSDKSNMLSLKIEKLKRDSSKLKQIIAYQPQQIDSFLVERYQDRYKILSKDTIHVPVPVAKEILVDLFDLDRTKDIVLNQDSLIDNLRSIIGNKDSIIVTLKTKENNYQSIISKQTEQQANYELAVSGLKSDLKKQNFITKINKVEKLAMTIVIVGLIATHK